MSPQSTSSRRSFLKAGAIVAAPLAVVAPAAALAENEHKARAQRLQDEAEIRALHAAWLRNVARGQDVSALFADAGMARLDKAVQGIAADHSGGEHIEVAADGLRATGRFAMRVDLETELPHTGTLAQMAHLQGGGRVRTTEGRTLQASYLKRNGGWAIAGLELKRA